MYNFNYLFLMFVIYAFLGWITEVIYAYYCHRKFINRGFLIGPCCPLYGIGAILVISFLKNYMYNFIVLFVLATVMFMVLEYFASYLMENIFNTRWWDYSDSKFNINGRICLEFAVPFGLGGLLIMYVINPFITGILDRLSSNMIIILGIISFIIFLAYPFIIIKRINNEEKVLEKDLKGYEKYKKKVKYKLIPYIW